MSTVSNIGILNQVTTNLQSEQATLAILNQQLASGTVHQNLTDYSTTQTGQLLNFQNAITQKQGYISSMQDVSTRLSLYDTTLSDLETVAQSGTTLATQNQTYNPQTLTSLQAQATNYLKQVTDDLNQQVGSRYLFAGVRYNTAPVADLSNLSGSPSTTTVSSPTLPVYDSAYVNNGTTSDANAYTKDTLTVDTGYNVTYGITSTDPAFQNLIAGLRYISAATTAGSAATYQSDMTTASTLLSSALNSIQTIHAQNSANQSTIKTETTNLNADISNLTNQVSNIQQVDLTQVGTQINFLQTQLQASYSSTASLEQLSILKYL